MVLVRTLGLGVTDVGKDGAGTEGGDLERGGWK